MKMETEFCVVTLNCWGIRGISKDRVPRMTAIAEELASGKYDFVFLQEVWTTEDYERIKRRTKDVLPFSYYFYSGVIGAGICIFSKSEIKSAFFHQWAVNGYIHKIQHGDWFGGKGIGMVEVIHRGLNINLYTTHLHAEYDRINDEYLAHRVIQAFDTAQFIKMTSKAADIVIVGGDLNTEPGDLAYKVITHVAQLRDSILDLDKPGPTLSLNTSETPRNSYSSPKSLKINPHGKRIDYICYRSGKSIEAKATSNELAWSDRVPSQTFSYSDHEAVVVRLKVSKSSSIVSSPWLDAGKEDVLSECVDICSNALEHLRFSKKAYGLLSLSCFFLLMVSGSFELPGMFFVILATTRVVTLLVLVFGIIMGTAWNRMEVNGILAGKLAMLLELGKPVDIDPDDFQTFQEGGGDQWANIETIDCAP